MCLYSYKLANALSEQGVKVSLFVDDRYELDHLPHKFSKRHVLSSRYNSIDARQNKIVRLANIFAAHAYNWQVLLRNVAINRPAVVHLQPQFYLVDWHALLLLKRKSSKVVITVHDVIPHRFYFERFSRVELSILQLMFSVADKLIVHSDANMKQLCKTFSVDRGKVVTIPHGEYGLESISSPICCTTAREGLHLPQESDIILFFGFIRENKGVDVLLAAFDLISSEFPNARLVVAGSEIAGETFSPYRQMIDRMPNSDRVHCFIKYIPHDEMTALFSAADIVTLPYRRFGSQSGVLHLAQGFAKPVIVTDVGGMPEVVENNETGLVVPSGDAQALANALRRLLMDKQLRNKLGEKAKQRAMDRFSWDAIAKATIEQVYQN